MSNLHDEDRSKVASVHEERKEKKKEGLETVSATGCRNGALVRIKTAGHC